MIISKKIPEINHQVAGFRAEEIDREVCEFGKGLNSFLFLRENSS